jgi:formylmethanofuran dehydrogenase subunit E
VPIPGDLERFLAAGELLHGHPCPPVAIGIRAGAVALERLGAARAVERELFAFVELAGDHWGQGFGDGIQVVTGCTFGKDNVARVALGKLGLTLLDQRRGRAVRVALRRGLLDGLESTEWFRRCARSGAPWAEVPRDEVDPVSEFILGAAPEGLFAVSPPFPMGVEEARPGFESAVCDGCAEAVLAGYLVERDGRRLCLRCDERGAAMRRGPAPRDP